MLDRYTKIAIIDITEHIIFGIISVAPLILKNPMYLFPAIFFSVFPDIDHIILARSLSVEKMLTLGRRPFLHSIPAVLLISAVVYGFLGFELAFIALLTGATHLVWDLCTGGVRLFYPVQKTFHLPQQAAFILIFLFAAVSFIISQL